MIILSRQNELRLPPQQEFVLSNRNLFGANAAHCFVGTLPNYDIASGKQWLKTGTVTDFTSQGEDVASSFGAASGYYCSTDLHLAQEWTIAAIFYPIYFLNVAGLVGLTDSLGSSTYDRCIRTNETTKVSCMLYDGTTREISSSTVSSAGVQEIVVASYRANTMYFWKKVIGGTLEYGTVTTSNAGYTGYTTPYFAINYLNSGAFTTQNAVSLAIAGPFGVSNEDVLDFINNPWQIFEGAKSYFIFAGDTGLSLSLNSLVSSSNLETTNLIQQNTLTPSSLVESVSYSTVSLLQQNILVLQNLIAAVGLDSPVLTTTSNLLIDSLSETTTLGSLNLIQQSSIVVNNISQVVILENITLTQQNVLSIASLSSGETLSNIVLSVAGTLGIDSLSVTQTLEVLNLTQANILTTQNVISTQTLQEITLTSGIILSPGNINETQNLSTLALIQANVLQLQGLLEPTTIQNIPLVTHTTLVVNDLLYNTLLQNITLIEGVTEYYLKGKAIFVLQDNPSIMIIDSNIDVFIQ